MSESIVSEFGYELCLQQLSTQWLPPYEKFYKYPTGAPDVSENLSPLAVKNGFDKAIFAYHVVRTRLDLLERDEGNTPIRDSCCFKAFCLR
jgi:hypothetical protein